MKIPSGYRTNFNTMLKAAKNGDLALLDCQDKVTGKQVVTIVGTYKDSEGQINFVPFAKMFDGNPYDELNPPDTKGAYVDDKA